jgi:hypothetical protein
MTQSPFYNVGTKKIGFWKRQFAPIPTPAQDTFDSAFAILLPILFLVIDPVVFKSPKLLGPAYLEDYQLLGYLFCSTEIGLFLTWRTFRQPLRRFSMAFAGAFFAGAMFSMVIGFVLLPLSVLGLMFVIGLLGFTPFVTAFVFLRNGVRAARINVNSAALPSRLAVAVLSGALVLGTPVMVQAKEESDLSATVRTLITGKPPEAVAAAERLKSFRFVPRRHSRQIAAAYATEVNPAKLAALKEAYRNVTGEDLEYMYRGNIFD